MAGLYIHVPFCVRKCRYCDFYSLPMTGGARLPCPNGPSLPDEFLSSLASELTQCPADFAPDTIFMGGGTPTALPARQLERLLSIVAAAVDCSSIVEWTCEVNPGTLDREKAALLRAAGVNRISLGVQSFDADVLSFLGRIHTAGEARDAYQLLRESGFTNISVDLIYAVPVATRRMLARDLDQLVALAPEHVSCYGLIFEDGTELTRLRDEGALAEVDDGEQAEQYRLVRSVLGRAGMEHYEISNFARPGRECRHNLLYWSGGEYIGCGPAAHSHWHGRRYSNVRDVNMYGAALAEGRSPVDQEETLDGEAKARETLVMSLRRLRGISREEFRARTGFDYRALRGKEIDWLCEVGLLAEEDDTLRLTEKGLFVSDSVFAELV